MSLRVACDWTCDFCGKTARTTAEPDAAPALPPGWHAFDEKHVCDEHQIAVVFTGVPAPEPGP